MVREGAAELFQMDFSGIWSAKGKVPSDSIRFKTDNSTALQSSYANQRYQMNEYHYGWEGSTYFWMLEQWTVESKQLVTTVT